jgi:RNAse (barnase) inhibitor barstar
MRDKLLVNAARSGLHYLPPGHRKSVEKSSIKLHFQFLHADLSACRNTTEALRQLGKSLHFPDWYGANFDALFDCLGDPSWQPAPGKVMLIAGTESLRLADPDGFATLVEVFEAAADAHRETGQPFWLLLDSATPGIAALPEA